MSGIYRYKTEPLQAWTKAKEIRDNYYREYAEAKQNGKLRWSGSGITLCALVKGFGDDIVRITGEPYGASIGANPKFALECQEATENKGYARDMCAYLRNYWGSMWIDKYAFGGPFPKPDFLYTSMFCCMQAKWYQRVAEEENIPYHANDFAMGKVADTLDKEWRVEYVANQCYDSIEWLEKTIGRKCDEEKVIKAIYDECRATSLWSKICMLNKARPAPLDEKSMYSLYVLTILDKSSPVIADFLEELLAEVQYRVDNQIAAVPTERCRIMHDSQPPWSFLKLFRYMEKFGVVSVGSYYTFCLGAAWDFIDGHMVPAKTPQEQGIQFKNLEEAIRFYADWNVRKRPIVESMHAAQPKIDYTLSIAKDWNADGAIMHFNRGCEGISLNCAEVRGALVKAGYPVMVYEGNHADDREFDANAAMSRLEAFMERLNLKKLVD
ncbi:MAG: benzoyl-CoA reductase, bzd-type, subunit O [Carboxydocellales bacterium]